MNPIIKEKIGGSLNELGQTIDGLISLVKNMKEKKIRFKKNLISEQMNELAKTINEVSSQLVFPVMEHEQYVISREKDKKNVDIQPDVISQKEEEITLTPVTLIEKQINIKPVFEKNEIMVGFLDIAPELVSNIIEDIEELKSGNTDSLSNIHRDLHKLKGSAGSINKSFRDEIHSIEMLIENSAGKDIVENLSLRFLPIKEYVQNLLDGNMEYNFKAYVPAAIVEQNISLAEIENKDDEYLNYLIEEDDTVDEIDHDIMPIFLEEAADINGVIIQQLESFKMGDREIIPELKRNLHTLKGNVGMVGALRARKELHEIEAVMAKLIENNFKDLEKVGNELQDRFEEIDNLLEAYQNGNYDYHVENYEIKVLKRQQKNNTEDSSPTQDIEILNVVSEKFITPNDKPKDEPKTNTSNNQLIKSIKVKVDILSRLINEANETKLARVGLLNNATTMKEDLADLEDNIARFSKMLRELEIHAESQIQSRRSQIEEKGEDFDPLELDRYTRLQELTRFLGEVINDIFDLQQNMSKASSEQETLLAYQERSVNEIHETLTKIRQVPFSSYTGRFDKTVKQTQKELGKDINFRVDGENIELDSFLLDKLLAPMGHIIRNAISHGIESKEDRIKAGKNPKGNLVISVKQDASKIYISVEDDGGGINIGKVRAKAIEKGLWDANKKMNDQQAADMICLPSFSTAETVSEISGRGVGMDVVRNEIISLGGNFDLHSVEGKGLVVNIQVPTTISTIWVLSMKVGNEEIAMPVDIVDKVFVEKTNIVSEYHKKGFIRYKVDEDTTKEIDFRNLSDVMELQPENKEAKPFTHMVVVKSDEQYMAVAVDEILGVREAPLRPAGKALSGLPGVVGVTILSNGRASFVLDIIRARNMITKHHGINYNTSELLPLSIMNSGNIFINENIKNTVPLIMVVDDSITVRKTTARFLQKVGFDSIMAKDGQDALEKLADVNPDLILLDVEMPRMNGFDFAKHVREHQRHNVVPIIMITSRIADKHRSNAKAIGVNEYVGKPFKEHEMLELLNKYIKK